MRAAVFAKLSTDGVLAGLGITVDDVWTLEAVDNPDRGKPFLVLAWADQPRTPWGASGFRDLLVWAHDDSADYSRIDSILERVKELLVGMVHEEGVSQVAFSGGSPDLYDDGFRTITRNYGFRVNARMEDST